jgi:RNase P subunit RPR2
MKRYRKFCKHCRRPLMKTNRGNWRHVAGGYTERQPKCRGPEPGGRPPLKGQLELLTAKG